MNVENETTPMTTTPIINTETERAAILAMEPCRESRAWLAAQTDALTAWQTCERGDWMIWWLRRTKRLNKPDAVRIAVACAERVLNLYESRHPGDDRPRKAIEAARAWNAHPSEETRQAAYAAAAAAYAAAAAAYAAAAAAAAADAYAERKAQADIIRAIITNPWVRP